MAALRINIRNKMLQLVAALPGIGPDNVSPHKLDKVEKGNEASVYLQVVDSQKGAMKGARERELYVNVSLFLSDNTDAEAKGAELLNTLEASVEAERKAGGFNDPSAISGVELKSASVAHDPTSKGKRADTHATFLFKYTEQLA